MAARGFLGAGDLYIDSIVGGVHQGFEGPFEATKFEIKPNSELKEMTSRGRYTYGQVIESVALAKPADFTVDLAEVNTRSLVIALAGTVGSFTQTSGTLTAEAVVFKLDEWIRLTKIELTGVVTVTDTAATTTFVEGDDYIINRPLGWIKALSSGAIAADEAGKVSGAYSAVASTRILGATEPQVRAAFMLDGVNFADGAPCTVTVHEGIVSSGTAFDFLADNFASISLPGRMKTPVGFTEPFTVDMRAAA